LFFVMERNNDRILEHDMLIIPSGLAQFGNFGPEGSPLVTVGKWRNLHACSLCWDAILSIQEVKCDGFI
jgi:hypothetical protein